MTSYGDESQLAYAQEPILPEVKQNIRAVFPVGSDAMENGVGEGLLFLKQLMQKYEEAGISDDEIHISAIFHSKASPMVLKDETYRRITKKQEDNPNKELIYELIDRGISLEICAMSMQKLGIRKDDLLPEITVVQSTFTRAIDLQMQGYAFVHF